MNTKNKKLTIPVILSATILIAGIFAFAPIENASSTHVETIASTVGLACATETVTLSAGIDGNAITLTYTPALQLLGLRVTINDSDDAIGFDALATVNGAEVQTAAVVESIDNEGDEILSQMDTNVPLTLAAGGALVLTVDDDDGSDMESTDVITFQSCVLVSDPTNFDATDILISGTGIAE